MTSSIVWVAQLYWEKNELNFVVDDETGMILSAYFYLYNNDALVNGRSDETAPAGADETARRLGEALCRSYGFENVTVEAETGSLGDETGRSLPRPITARNILPSAIYALHSTAKPNAE